MLSRPIPAGVARGAVIKAYTDTCAQTCISGEHILTQLKFRTEDLLPTSHRILGVTGKYANILGILLVRVEHRGRSAPTAVYICKNIKGFFLCAKVQSEVGVLPVGYPNARCVGVTTAPPNTTVRTGVGKTAAASRTAVAVAATGNKD